MQRTAQREKDFRMPNPFYAKPSVCNFLRSINVKPQAELPACGSQRYAKPIAARAHCKHKSLPRSHSSPWSQVHTPHTTRAETDYLNTGHWHQGHGSVAQSVPSSSLCWTELRNHGSCRKHDLVTLQSHCPLYTWSSFFSAIYSELAVLQKRIHSSYW